MITRGITYYNVADLKKNIYKTVDAKKLEDVLIDGGIDISKMDYLSSLMTEKRTNRLSLFQGDLLIQFVPKEAVHLFFQLKVFKEMGKDPLISSLDIEENIQKLEDELMEFDKDLQTNSFAIIYQINSADSKQLITVGTCLPENLLKYLTDERIYHTVEDEIIVSDDGIPDEVFYYYDEESKIKYTLDVDKGRQIGT